MADNLPAPESRVESYLAKAAGEDVTIPEKPLSRTEQYLAAIAEGGGGGGGTTYTAGANIQISADNVISATDTTYSNFVGTDGADAGTAGLVPAPATTDDGKFLNADGTWQTVQAGPTVVQTTGTSTTDVMSQKATTDMIFADGATASKIQIGNGSLVEGDGGIAIGSNTKTYSNGYRAVTIGSGVSNNGYGAVVISNDASGSVSNVSSWAVMIGPGTACYDKGGTAIGAFAKASWKGSVAIGPFSGNTAITANGMVSFDSSDASYGYNNSKFRLLTGLYDGQSAHDAATYGQMNTRLGGLTLLTISQTDYDNLGTKDPNTLYVITGA